MKPLVSILIPAFNAQNWIADSIQSAIDQTWPDKEIIIVDDGSTDQTLAIAQRFSSKEVAVFSQKNQGAASARNHALSLSQGDYIQWLDADDLLSPNKVALQMRASKECPGDRTLYSSAWCAFAYRADRAKVLPTSLWCDLSPIEWMLRKLGGNLHMQTATWLASRELTEAAGPWDTRLLVDNDGEYFCRMILASNGVRFVPDAKVFYRITSSSRLSYIGHSNRKKDSLFLSMQLHVKYIRSLEDSDRVRDACQAYLQNWLINFYPERADVVEQLERLATSLGRNLQEPQLPSKYAWIKALFGWGLAKWTQRLLPRLKESCLRFWDGAMYHRERSIRRRASSVAQRI